MKLNGREVFISDLDVISMEIPDTTKYRVCIVEKTDNPMVWKNWPSKTEADILVNEIKLALQIYRDTPILTEEEINRPPTKKHLEMLKKADEYYKQVSGHLEKEDYEFLIEQLDPNVDDGYTADLVDKLKRHL